MSTDGVLSIDWCTDLVPPQLVDILHDNKTIDIDDNDNTTDEDVELEYEFGDDAFNESDCESSDDDD